MGDGRLHRKSVMLMAGIASVALQPCTGLSMMPEPLRAAWSSADADWRIQRDDSPFIAFNEESYRAMADDVNRTPLYEEALTRRLRGRADMTVLDIGTGPFALLALAAARRGAARVFAVEANPAVAARARETVAAAEAAGDVGRGVVEVFEGFSSDVELPCKVWPRTRGVRIVCIDAEDRPARANHCAVRRRRLTWRGGAVSSRSTSA